jgi:hypothetical protein
MRLGFYFNEKVNTKEPQTADHRKSPAHKLYTTQMTAGISVT